MSLDDKKRHLQELRAAVQEAGGQDRIDARHEKGQLTARERI